MAENTKTSSDTAAENVAAPTLPPDDTQARQRSGLTGHLRPIFWRMRPSTTILTADTTASTPPEASTAPPPVFWVGGALKRWWHEQQRRTAAVDRATILVIVCTLLSLGIYLYGTLRFPLGPNLSHKYQDIRQLTQLGPNGPDNPIVGEYLLLAITLLFAAWGLVCWIAGRVERQTKAGWWRTPILLGGPLFGFPAVALLIMLFMYPITAVDVFDYASQIRVLTIYHANPLTIAPASFPHDPFLPFNPWLYQPSSYAPLWIVLSALVSLPAGNNFFAAVLAQKLLAIVACLGCMGLVWLLARRLCPERRWQAFVFWAWNPLVLFETGANGHNDAVMVVFMLAGLLALISTRWYWQALALPLLVASALIKWTSALLLPLALIYLLRSGRPRWKRLIPIGLGTLLTVAYSIPLILPFWDPEHKPGVLLQATYFTASPPALLHSLLVPIYGDDLAGTITRLLGIGCFALVYLAILAHFAFPGVRAHLEPWNKATLPQRLIHAGMESYFWYLVLATFWFQAWYLVALLPLAALDFRPLARVRNAFFSLGALLSYIIFDFLWVIYWWHIPTFTVLFVACVVIYGLALFTRTLEHWQDRQQLYALLARVPVVPARPEATPRRKSWWLL